MFVDFTEHQTRFSSKRSTKNLDVSLVFRPPGRGTFGPDCIVGGEGEV